MVTQTLYHGTCQAFVEFARQNNGNFGPSYDSVSFTPNIVHAEIFASSWDTSRGRERLNEFFGEQPDAMYSPVVLEFDSGRLGDLVETEDAGAIEFFRESGPVSFDALIDERRFN